jgi:hypothetical protein
MCYLDRSVPKPVSIALVLPYHICYTVRDKRRGLGMPQRRKTEIVQVNLRLREDLRRYLLKEAGDSGRSFNQELVYRLEQSLEVETAKAMLERARAIMDRALKEKKRAAEIYEAMEAILKRAPQERNK